MGYGIPKKYTDAEAIAAAKSDPVYTDDLFEVDDDGDATKDVVFQLAGATTGKRMTLTMSQTDDRSVTFPDATGTLEIQANKDAANGYPGLDASSRITNVSGSVVLNDAFNQSRNSAALAAAGYTLVEPGSCTVTEGASFLSVVAASASDYNWYNAVRASPNIAYPIPYTSGDILVYASCEMPDVSKTGCAMILDYDGANDWYRNSIALDGANRNREVIRQPTTSDYNAADGAVISWLGWLITGDRAYALSVNQAWGTEPTVATWDELVGAGRQITTIRGASASVRLVSLSWDTQPGGTAKYGQLTILRL